jgi:hypothetical protein
LPTAAISRGTSSKTARTARTGIASVAVEFALAATWVQDANGRQSGVPSNANFKKDKIWGCFTLAIPQRSASALASPATIDMQPGLRYMQGKLRNSRLERTAWLGGGRRQAFWVPPCRNDGVPCKELAMALPEYDSERSVIPAWHRWQKEGKQR